MWNDFITLNNVGTREGGIRLGAGGVAVLWGITGGGFLLAIIGAVLAVTGFYNSCQIYKLMGRNTNTGATATAAASAAAAPVAKAAEAVEEVKEKAEDASA